ncbi:DUF2730 domain-containing protein [Providencia rettgeri]|uniref:DUF2730 domain-containing protein n=1 Tax=Providencia rettgeri TaxID=587 RepID=UPI00206C34E7|nr:DUF2730 domain-containing protein [Providencia rettgeri]UPQ40711.1 DUF2730 domain-containing protein [Providencia rettgeri]
MKNKYNVINNIILTIGAASGLISALAWHLSARFSNQSISGIENEWAAIAAIVSAGCAYTYLILSQFTSNTKKEDYIKKEDYNKLIEEIESIKKEIKPLSISIEEQSPSKKTLSKKLDKEKIFS